VFHSRIFFVTCAVAFPLFAAAAPSASNKVAPVAIDRDGRLSYQPDGFGNVVPDFSLAGYRHGGVALPVAPVIVHLAPDPDSDDDSRRIQAAIDKAAAAPENSADGVRGAVLLAKGSYRCGRTLSIPAGVTLRGMGQDADGTVIVATMVPGKGAGSQPILIRMTGKGGLRTTGAPHALTAEKVPIGSHHVTVADARVFKVGQRVIVERASTASWIRDLKMDQIQLNKGGKQWSPKEYVLRWQSRIQAINGDVLTLDTPVICSLERQYGGGSVYACAADTRGRAAAVESIRLVSIYQNGAETKDEGHAWDAIRIDSLVDCWVREVTALHFADSCVNVGQSASRITVQDCAMIDPVSLIAGGRRYSFVGSGQYVLFQRCYTRNGRHDFVTGKKDVGPTVFLDCLAEKTHSDIGPHHRWSCGQLYDNVKGGAIHVQDRGASGTGHGWAGNAQVLWNCEAKTLICQKPWPPGCQNWAIGCTGADRKPSLAGRPEGFLHSRNSPVEPRSLYLAQLKQRIDRSGGNGGAAILAVTTGEQRRGNLWKSLRERYAQEPEYPKSAASCNR
jgi:hypothetical protein